LLLRKEKAVWVRIFASVNEGDLSHQHTEKPLTPAVSRLIVRETHSTVQQRRGGGDFFSGLLSRTSFPLLYTKLIKSAIAAITKTIRRPKRQRNKRREITKRFKNGQTS